MWDHWGQIVSFLEKDKTLSNEDRKYIWEVVAAQKGKSHKTNPFANEPLHMTVGIKNVTYDVVGYGYTDPKEFETDIDKRTYEVPEVLTFRPSDNKQIEFKPLPESK